MSRAARMILPRHAAGNVADEIERAAAPQNCPMNLASLTEYLTGPPHRVHLIGVAGSGMSGIAGLLLALGHRVSGSDKVATVEVGRLEKKGLRFRVPHQADEVQGAELVVYSSAIKPGNVAYDEARRLGLPDGAAGGCSGGDHEFQEGDRDLRHARQDDHFLDGGPRAAKLWAQAIALCRCRDPDPRLECTLGLEPANTLSPKATRATEP